MNSWSLKSRLLILAACGISIVLGIAGFGFSWLYRKHVEKFVLTELTSHMDQLLGDINLQENGVIAVNSTLSDPRFEEAGGGLYWQVDVAGQPSIRSRSLWDETITIPTPPETTEEDHAHILVLPSGLQVFSLEKLVIATNDKGMEKKTVVTVGIDRDRVTNPVSDFLQAMLFGLALTYGALLASTLAFITFGLKPLEDVKRGVTLLRGGTSHIDTSKLPREIKPLAEEVNALVAAREVQLDNARKRASNLAHGLKTPLAVMQSVSNELKLLGKHEASDTIALNASQMRDLIDRELTRSRMASGHNIHRARLDEVLLKVIATMKKAPRGENITWNHDIADNTFLPIDAVDLTELLGNLLDNARKYAQKIVTVTYVNKQVIIEDDGVGVSGEKVNLIFQRGVRLDEKLAGSGIGLAIVSDLAEVYNLDVRAYDSKLGGLAVSVGFGKNELSS